MDIGNFRIVHTFNTLFFVIISTLAHKYISYGYPLCNGLVKQSQNQSNFNHTNINLMGNDDFLLAYRDFSARHQKPTIFTARHKHANWKTPTATIFPTVYSINTRGATSSKGLWWLNARTLSVSDLHHKSIEGEINTLCQR